MGKYMPMLFDGLKMTLGLAAVGVLIGIVLGAVLAMMKLSRLMVCRAIASAYIEIIRGTPVLLQVFIMSYGIPMLLGMKTPYFLSGSIALGLNSSAYVAEIFRSGIQAVGKGQTEAARSLGMSKSLTMSRIIMPQAVRNVLPALGNEFITVVKESSVVSVIGLGDLMYKSKFAMGASYTVFEPLLIAAALYFIVTFPLSKIVNYAEKRLRRGDRDDSGLRPKRRAKIR